MISRPAMLWLVTVLTATLIMVPAIVCAEPLQGITTPKADITLSFVVPGKINEILVQEGSIVNKDQLLVSLFDTPERIKCEQLKMLADDRTKILAAKAELAQKKVDLRKLEMAHTKGAASDWEIEHLQLNVRIAELSLKSAIIEQAQYQRRYDHARSQIEKMRLVAPIAGRIEDVSAAAGESIGTLGPVIRLVQNDPLWIDIPVPLKRAIGLTAGQKVWVTFPGDPAPAEANGRIINIASVADAASDTLRVRVEVPNSLKRPAGERVSIAFAGDDKVRDKNLAQLQSE